MTLILFLICVKSIFSTEWDPNHFRLPGTVIPSHYEIDLKPYLDPEDQGESYTGTEIQHFDGISTVYFTALEETSLLVLNSKYIDYKTLIVTNISKKDQNIPIVSYYTNDTHPNEYIYITLSQNLQIDNEYKLETTYTGYLKNDNFGFYIR